MNSQWNLRFPRIFKKLKILLTFELLFIRTLEIFINTFVLFANLFLFFIQTSYNL